MILKDCLKFFVGAIGTIAGIGLLSTGCDDGDSGNSNNRLSQAEIQKCCGADNGSNEYMECVKDYSSNGVCSSQKENHDLPAYYGPNPYASQEVIDCCGADSSADGWQACADDYIANGVCADKPIDEPLPTYYGPDPVES